MRDDGERGETDGDASDDEESVHVSVNLQCRQIEQRQLVPDEMRILAQRLPQKLAAMVANLGELSQARQQDQRIACCSKQPVEKP